MLIVDLISERGAGIPRFAIPCQKELVSEGRVTCIRQYRAYCSISATLLLLARYSPLISIGSPLLRDEILLDDAMPIDRYGALRST
jgi:hypothetical protein